MTAGPHQLPQLLTSLMPPLGASAKCPVPFPTGALCSSIQLQSSELQTYRCTGLHAAASTAVSAAFGLCRFPAEPWTLHMQERSLHTI